MKVKMSLLVLLGCGAMAGSQARQLSGFDCLIVPRTTAEVSTREEGILEQLLVGRGDQVKQGQVIAYLNRDVEQASVALARARAEQQAEIEEFRETLALAQRESARINKLSRAKAISLTEKDRAATDATRAGLQLQQALERQTVARLELARAERILANRMVRSPLEGVVVARMMSVGESVENRPIVKIAEIDPLYVEIIVPVDYIGAIAPGMRAEIAPRYPGAVLHQATVTVVDHVVDAASDTFGVRLELPNPDQQIPGGVRCGIRFLDSDSEVVGNSP